MYNNLGKTAYMYTICIQIMNKFNLRTISNEYAFQLIINTIYVMQIKI